MSVIEQATQDKEASLISIDPMIEVHLHLIISTFEKGNKESLTEDGIFASMYGELGKHESNLGAFRKTSSTYGGMDGETFDMETGEHIDSSVTATDGMAEVTASIEGVVGGTADAIIEFAINPPDTFPDGSPNVFAQCFPCDHRITILAETLPLPDWSFGYQKYIDQIKSLVNQILAALNPVNFYADICALLDMLRIVCPQDLTLLITMLNFMLARYVVLSIQLDLDWVSLVGIILLPLIMLLVALFDIMLSIGLNPINCLQTLIESFTDLASAGINLAGSIGAIGVASTGEEIPNQTGGVNNPIFSTSLEMPVRNEMIDEKMAGMLGELSSLDTLLLGMSSIQFRMPGLYNQLLDVQNMLLEIINDAVTVKSQLMLALLSLIKLVAFIWAVIDALANEELCSDPTIPMSEDDIKNVFERMKNLQIGLTPTVDVTFDDASGAVVITDTITNQSNSVPMCLGGVGSETLTQITDWIEQLDALD